MTDSVFCLYDPWPATIPLTRPATGADGIFSLADDHIVENDCGMNVRYRAAHFTYNSNRWQYWTNTKRLRIACKSVWWRVPLTLLTVNDRTSTDERKHNRRACRMEKGKSSTLGWARCRFKRLRRVETKVEIKRKWQRQATCGCQ